MNENRSFPWLFVLWLLAALGVPIGITTLRIEDIVQHPWLALGTCVIYEVLITMLGFATRVWSELEERWTPKIADAIEQWVARVSTPYRTRYKEFLINRHRDFDVKGLTTQGIYVLELEQVFVDLKLRPQPAHLIPADPIRPANTGTNLLTQRYPIWKFLTHEQLHHLAIIGPPGSGKTTLLKHITLHLAEGKKQNQEMQLPNTLPILLFLRDHSATIQAHPNTDLVDLLQSTLRKWDYEAPKGWFKHQLHKGQCLIMLDGLDEVANPDARKKVATWVEQQVHKYTSNHFLLTSRPHGYQDNPVSGFNVLEVLPFNQQQIRQFVENWYFANEIMSTGKDDLGVKMKAQEGAEDLLRRLSRAPALADLAVNPLLLTMIATVHRYRSSLPGRRVELYKEIFEVFLGKRKAAFGIVDDLTPMQKQRVLQPLAWHLMVTQQREISRQEAIKVIAPTLSRVAPEMKGGNFLQLIEQGSGLLVEQEAGRYGFAHLTFQEYLASVHALENHLIEELAQHVEKSWWRETLRLYAAQTDATFLLTTCLKQDPPSAVALALALDIENEAREVEPKTRERLQQVVRTGAEGNDAERQHIVAEAMLTRRIRHLIRLDEQRYVDPEPIKHIEYQLFVDEKAPSGKFHQPDHWQNLHFSNYQALEPVVGVRASDAEAFCHWLTERGEGSWHYRLPHSSEVPPSSKKLQTWWVLDDGKRRLSRHTNTAIHLERARDLDFAHDLEDALTRALDRLRARAHTYHDLENDIALACTHTLSIARSLARDLNARKGLALALARILTDTLNLDNNITSTPPLNPEKDIVRAFTLSLTSQSRANQYFAHFDNDRVALRFLPRWFTLIILSQISLHLKDRRPKLYLWNKNLTKKELEALSRLKETYTYLYRDLLILEKRIAGELPAVEGIYIVRERKT